MSKNYLKKSKQKKNNSNSIFNTALIEQLKKWEGKSGTTPTQDRSQKQD